jgi:hypothetical protein
MTYEFSADTVVSGLYRGLVRVQDDGDGSS